MPSVKLYNMKASEVGTLELSDKVFNAEYNEAAIHQAVVTRLANDRQGTKSTLTRSEVRGGGAKPYRQKGTGRARQGSIRSPQWVKGGVVFAPKSRDFSKKLNAKAKEVALLSALSQKVRDNEAVFVDELKLDVAKTKEMAAFLKAFGLDKTVLVVLDDVNVNVERASANLANVSTIKSNLINVYDVVKNAKIVISKKAAEQIQEVYGE
ncbi:MAG TPA: 50S ribosomal protein L4 [Clostridiales bacterium]|nr:50S ribosomal protein L4 [Clostridiales bacterium]